MISRLNRSTETVAASSSGRTLMTTVRPSALSRATNTLDMPPPPSSRSRVKDSPRVRCSSSRRTVTSHSAITGGRTKLRPVQHLRQPKHHEGLRVSAVFTESGPSRSSRETEQHDLTLEWFCPSQLPTSTRPCLDCPPWLTILTATYPPKQTVAGVSPAL